MNNPTVKDVRKVNRSLVLKEFYFNSPVSRLDVSRTTHLSPATVTNIVNELLESNILVEEGLVESSGGRPSTLLKVNPHLGYFLGIELGEEHLNAELFDIYFSPVTKYQATISQNSISPEEIVDEIMSAVSSIIESQNLESSDILGVGIGVPGIVDTRSGLFVFAPNWGWENVNLADKLKEKLPIPFYIDNGNKAMGIAEMLFGYGRESKNYAVMMIGKGVGGAIIQDGALIRGETNVAGEFGHMTMDVEGPACRCGSQGCLETLVGARGLIEHFNQLSGSNYSVNFDSVDTLIQDYENGSETATIVIDQALRYLGAAIANIINIENPERIIIGGPLGLKLGKTGLEKIRNHVQKYVLPGSVELKNILVSELTTNAVPMGAASLALIDFFENLDQTTLMNVGGRRMKTG
jgi:predicted NBD/HSP70 family sugar kinase